MAAGGRRYVGAVDALERLAAVAVPGDVVRAGGHAESLARAQLLALLILPELAGERPA